MKVEKKDLEKSQVELTVELSLKEFEPYIKQGAEKVSHEVKIDGFRPGKVPMDVLKKKIGEMTILEESARIAINKTLDKVIKDNVEQQPVGQPKVDITKIAPGNPMEYKVTMALLPEIILSDYKTLKIKSKKVEINEKENEKMLQDLREMRAKEVIVDREVKDNDKVIVDIDMFLDKVPVDGGQSKDTGILMGKDYIVPGFDKKVLGAKKGDVREFSLPYAKEYHMKNLAGKMVDFKVAIKEVYSRELPELNDEFALGFGLKKIEELKENIKKNILDQKTKEASQVTEKEMLEKIIEKTKFGDIPEMLVDHETKTMLAELEHTVSQQGAKFDDYLTSINKTKDQLTLDILPEAVKRVKVSLLVREVADKEKIKVKEEEIVKNIEEIKKHYKDNKEALEKVTTPDYRNYVVNVLTSRKVVDKLREWNVVN